MHQLPFTFVINRFIPNSKDVNLLPLSLSLFFYFFFLLLFFSLSLVFAFCFTLVFASVWKSPCVWPLSSSLKLFNPSSSFLPYSAGRFFSFIHLTLTQVTKLDSVWANPLCSLLATERTHTHTQFRPKIKMKVHIDTLTLALLLSVRGLLSKLKMNYALCHVCECYKELLRMQ